MSSQSPIACLRARLGNTAVAFGLRCRLKADGCRLMAKSYAANRLFTARRARSSRIRTAVSVHP